MSRRAPASSTPCGPGRPTPARGGRLPRWRGRTRRNRPSLGTERVPRGRREGVPRRPGVRAPSPRAAPERRAAFSLWSRSLSRLLGDGAGKLDGEVPGDEMSLGPAEHLPEGGRALAGGPREAGQGDPPGHGEEAEGPRAGQHVPLLRGEPTRRSVGEDRSIRGPHDAERDLLL